MILQDRRLWEVNWGLGYDPLQPVRFEDKRAGSERLAGTSRHTQKQQASANTRPREGCAGPALCSSVIPGPRAESARGRAQHRAPGWLSGPLPLNCTSAHCCLSCDFPPGTTASDLCHLAFPVLPPSNVQLDNTGGTTACLGAALIRTQFQ